MAWLPDLPFIDIRRCHSWLWQASLRQARLRLTWDLSPSSPVMIVGWLWSYETTLQKWNVNIKDNSIFKCVIINKITMYFSELTPLLLSYLMVKIIYLYFLLAPNPAWSFHLVGRWGVWQNYSLMKQTKHVLARTGQWIVWTQKDQICLSSLVLDCPWKPHGTFVKWSSSRARA